MSAAITHGRHCPCSACAREDWSKIEAPCGMHGPECPPTYAPVAAIAPDRTDPLDWYIEVCVICGCQLGPGIGSRTKTGRCVNPDHHQAGGKVVRVMERVA